MHLCAELAAATWMLEPFGEGSANFHCEHSLLKLKIKKNIAENQWEKHKNQLYQCQTVWIQIRTDILSVLIRVQDVCKSRLHQGKELIK